MQKLTDGILLYHGSYIEIPKIDLNKCTKGLDFGKRTDDFTIESLLPNKLEDQFCFLTSKAINALEYLGSEPYGR